MLRQEAGKSRKQKRTILQLHADPARLDMTAPTIALRNGAPFAEMPPAFRALQRRMLRTPGGDREMVEILALVLQHDQQAVLAAVELALEAGAPTKTHILNLVHRLVDRKPIDPLPVNPPNALTLTTEPQANVGRYDALRKAPEARLAS